MAAVLVMCLDLNNSFYSCCRQWGLVDQCTWRRSKITIQETV